MSCPQCGRYEPPDRETGYESDKFCSPECEDKYDTTDDFATRFWEKVKKTDGCWIWCGACGDRRGYGRFATAEKLDMAHRVAYELSIGKIEEGFTIDHLCKNPACVNPSHLEAVSHGENVRRHYRAIPTCKNGHSWNVENTRYRKGGTQRSCRMCERQNCRNYRAKRRYDHEQGRYIR